MFPLSFSVFNRFHLSPRGHRPAGTPNLLRSSTRGRFRLSSPLRRVVKTLSPVAYRLDLPTVGRRRTSPVMTQDHFLQAATRSTHSGPPPVTASPAEERASDSSVLHRGAVIGTPRRPKCRLPKSSRLAPSSPILLRSSRWRASCIPPANAAGFERNVLYGRGPAQVGFGDSRSPPFFTSPFAQRKTKSRATGGSRAPLGLLHFVPSRSQGFAPGLT